MFGGLVNAFLRPLQSILPHQQQQQPQQDGTHKSSSNNASSSSAFLDATPLKPFPASSFFTPGPSSMSSASLSPSPSPASPTTHLPSHAPTSEFAPLATPQAAFTPAPKGPLFKQSNQLNHATGRSRLAVPVVRKNRFSVHDTPQQPAAAVVEDEEASSMEPVSEEDKENHVGGKKRPASPSTIDNPTSGANGEEVPQFHMGTTTANKRMKLDSSSSSAATTDSPRKPRKSLRSSAAVQTASIFNFGPLSTTQRHVPLFTSKTAAAGAKVNAKPTKQEGELSHSLGGVQISQPPSSTHIPTSIPNPFQSGTSAPIVNPFSRQPSMTAIPSGAAAAAAAPQPSVVVEDTDVEMRDSPNEGAVSPGSHIPMHGMSISSASALPSNSFRAMSLGEPSNPFNKVQNQTNAAAAAADTHDDVHAQRLKAHRASREARTKDAYASIRASRAADKVEAQKQTAATEGARIDIKTKTKAAPTPREKILSQQQTYNPHVPVMRAQTASRAAAAANKPPVPLFWESNNSNSAASTQKPFAPLVQDALFAAAKNAAQNASPAILNPSAVPSFSLHSLRTQHAATAAPQQPPASASAATAAAPAPTSTQQQKDATEKARVSIKHGCTSEGVSGRVEQNRRDREQARAEATRKGREKALHQRREAATNAMNHLHPNSSSGSEMEQDASPTAESPTNTRPLRRSARHSISPSVSPSPPPPMGAQTPSPRNRFVTPIVTPAGAADASRLNTPSPVAHERRTRASMRASPSPPNVNVQRPQPKTAEQIARQKAELAQSIASRKATEQAAAADRLRERQAAMRASEQQAQKEAMERDEWKGAVSRRVAQRSRGKNFLGLLAEFTPSLRAELKPSDVNNLEALRKMMRKAMAKFHPDKHTNSPAKNKLEAEEIFVLLKKAYDELTALCR